jgi:hypothetical protein
MRIIISRGKRSWKDLLASVIIFAALAGVVYGLPPTYTTKIAGYSFSVLVLFFPLVFAFLFTLNAFLFRSKKHAALLSFFLVTCMVFLLNHLTQPFFYVLLAALVLVLEILIVYIK